MALAGRLRLAPQSREHARTTTRRANKPPPSIYQIMREQDDATNGELPADVDPDELNVMIGDIAHELGCPYDMHPGHVNLDADPEREAGSFNRGCTRDGKPWDGPTIYREGQRWRRRAIAELKRRPEWAQLASTRTPASEVRRPPSKVTWTVLWATGDATDSIKAPSAHRRPKHGSPAAFRSARHGDLG